jgi:hypothetical protein
MLGSVRLESVVSSLSLEIPYRRSGTVILAAAWGLNGCSRLLRRRRSVIASRGSDSKWSFATKPVEQHRECLTFGLEFRDVVNGGIAAGNVIGSAPPFP